MISVEASIFVGTGIYSENYGTLSYPKLRFDLGLSYKHKKDRYMNLYIGSDENLNPTIVIKVETLF